MRTASRMGLVERLRATGPVCHHSANAGLCHEAADMIAELLEALEAISEGHLPDQPAASSLDEYEWAVQHVRKLRKIARAAIAHAKGETQ